jgi:hypothetical protein
MLRAVNELGFTEHNGDQRLALQRVTLDCQQTIDVFIERIEKFDEGLRLRPIKPLSKLTSMLKKIQWVTKEEDVRGFRDKIAEHIRTMNGLIGTMLL